MQDFSGEACSVAPQSQASYDSTKPATAGMLAWSTSEWTSEPLDDDIYEVLKLTMCFSEKSTAKKGPSPQNKGLDYCLEKNRCSVHSRPANPV
ncbi:hypothetical protein MHYP_G00090350 [Metynnis hypsauchen]